MWRNLLIPPNKFRDDALYAAATALLNEIEAIHKTPNLNLAERWKIYAGGISHSQLIERGSPTTEARVADELYRHGTGWQRSAIGLT